MSELKKYIFQNENYKTIIISISLLVLVQLLRLLLNRSVTRSKKLKTVEKLNVKNSINLYFNIITIVLLIVLWFSQVQAIFVSLFAILAAIVVATKELIMTIMGGLLLNINNYFRLGDRIEIDGVRGFVMEKSLTVTKILVIGPEKNSQQTTGDMIIIPNSIMLSKPFKNESYFKDYSIKTFTLTLPESFELDEFEESLLSWANEICSSYLEEAEKTIGSFCKKENLIIPSVSPRVKIIIEQGKIDLLLKMPVQNQSIGDVEQQIFRKYIAYQKDKANEVS